MTNSEGQHTDATATDMRGRQAMTIEHESFESRVDVALEEVMHVVDRRDAEIEERKQIWIQERLQPESFIDRIKRETGRDIEKDGFRCDKCDGHGFSMWEPICTACAGEGETDEFVYADCHCRVEKEEDPDRDCELCFPDEAEMEAAA